MKEQPVSQDDFMWKPIRWILWRIYRSIATVEPLLHQLVQGHTTIMAAIDTLTTSVDNAVAEMAAIAAEIRNNPTANQDPALMALAARLDAAVTDLKSVDPAQIAAEAGGQNPAP